MVGLCKCDICNAPEPEPHCLDCGHIFRETEDMFKDRLENPMCEKCYMKMIDKADAIRKAMKEEDALNREMKGRAADKKESDRINGRW